MKGPFSTFQKAATAMVLYALLMPVVVSAGDSGSDKKKLTEDQKVLHVLNRLGYGARPGDVEKVKAIGLQKYIEQQLNASAIDDTVAENKVKGLEIFNMTTAEVFAKYPNPGALLRQLEGGRQAQADKAQANADKMPADPAKATEDEQRERQKKLDALYREYDLRPARQTIFHDGERPSHIVLPIIPR